MLFRSQHSGGYNCGNFICRAHSSRKVATRFSYISFINIEQSYAPTGVVLLLLDSFIHLTPSLFQNWAQIGFYSGNFWDTGSNELANVTQFIIASCYQSLCNRLSNLFIARALVLFQNFKPVAYKKGDYGKFYTGDSYIVLFVSIYLIWVCN